MRPYIACCMLFALALPGQAQQKPNTLTPKEIADGWILLFDGETTFGWNGKALKAVDGALHFGDLGAGVARSSVPFVSFEFRAEYQCDTKNTLLGVKGSAPGVESYQGQFLPMSKEWTPVRLHVENRKIVIDVPGTEPETKFPFDWTDPCVIRINQGKNTVTKLRNIKLRPLNMKPLFNGKDLAGWKEFPGKKSKFAIVDNAINVKDGPGDLQTAGKHKDFILQLDCISHGKHLNSGIFFRCRDGEYQNGYEAQIHNGFDEKPKKYLIDEYDPKTNKLLGKKEMLFNALDYGTGAIYRRMPARKQLAKDGEWFTMTVVAHGNHLATWVNGVQVTDWYDHRPKSDNARTGCKLEAGHISIQGHDPTTNLSFKNFRIAELK